MYERNDFAEPMSDQHPEIASFCGNREMLGDGSGARKLPTNRPKVFFHQSFKLPGVEREAAIAAVLEGANRWSGVADVEFSRTADMNDATFAVYGVKLDGPSGVLADCQMYFGQKLPLQVRFDTGERRWSLADDGEGIPIPKVSCHEFGHGLLLGHLPDGPPPELMEARISHISHPQQTEAAIIAKVYGEPKSSEEPPVSPFPGVTELSAKFGPDGRLEVSFIQDGKRREAKGQAKVVA